MSRITFELTLHVSDSSSVHHQEFFTAHTAMVYVIMVLLTAYEQDHDWTDSTCFGQFLCPSWEFYHCKHSNGMSYRLFWQLASRIRMELPVPSWSCSQAVSKHVWHIPMLCVQWKTPDDGQRNCPKHVEFYSKNKFEKLVHLVGFIIRIYHDARSPERQESWINSDCKFHKGIRRRAVIIFCFQ